MRSAFLGLVTVAACASAHHPDTLPEKTHKTIELEPLRIDVSKDSTHTFDARGLLDDGNDALMRHKYDEALVAYEHLIDDFPESKLVISALYNSGLAMEGKTDWNGAVERYRQLIASQTSFKDSEDFLNAEYRLGAVLAEIDRYPESITVFEKVLEKTDLQPKDRIEALARLGFALVQTKDYTGGEDVLRQTLAYFREIQATTRLENDYFVAMAQFYLAEIPRLQFEAVPLRYPEQQMVRDLDQKSQLFMLARDRYIKTVDFKNAYWATAAVYSVAAMYKTFWDHWMSVSIPSEFNDAEIKEYIKQINEQPSLHKLLEKALLYHERNVAMAKDVGVDNGWTRQSATDAEIVRQIIARQQRKDYLTPGSGTSAGSAAPAVRPAPDSSTPATTAN